MGLHISSLSDIPDKINGIKYFLYILDYNSKIKINPHTILNNCLNEIRVQRESLLITGVHVSNEIISWHNLFGITDENTLNTTLPAILLTTIQPKDILSGNIQSNVNNSYLVPIGDLESNIEIAKKIEEILRNIDKIFSKKTSIINNIIGKIFNTLILQPNFFGIGIDFKKIK